MSASHEVCTPPRLRSTEYLTGLTFGAFLSALGEQDPFLYDLLDSRCRSEAHVLPEIMRLNRLSWEFEVEEDGGRGADYNRAQRNADNRRAGMSRLLAMFGEDDGEIPGPDTLILDALAGDGTLRRFSERFGDDKPEIISADIARFMIDACRVQGYRCIRQSASKSFLADDTLDGVLIAYGSHHLSARQRHEAAVEAHRTLKPGGKFILHDFETGGHVDRWFRDVVDPYSATGHPHPHFSRDEMSRLLADAGFGRVSVFLMEDPFTVRATCAARARQEMLRHLHAMYGLVKLPIADEPALARLERLTQRTLGDIHIVEAAGQLEAVLMRHALIAVGVKT